MLLGLISATQRSWFLQKYGVRVHGNSIRSAYSRTFICVPEAVLYRVADPRAAARVTDLTR